MQNIFFKLSKILKIILGLSLFYTINLYAITLEDSYQLALLRSESVSISLDDIQLSEEKMKQARAAYFPALSLQASLTEQDRSVHPLAQNLTSTSQFTSNINFNQNIFQGFKDLYKLKQLKNLKVGYEWAKKKAMDQLYKDVAQSFFSILIYQSDIKLYKEQIQSTHQRKSELASAKRSGRARDSDLLSAESSIASVEASLAKIQMLQILDQESFRFLTGLSNDVTLENNVQFPNKLNVSSQWLEKIEKRPDVQQAKSFVTASEFELKSMYSGYYPTLDFNANYYLKRPNGIFKGVQWDIGLLLNFPIFSGGITKAQIAESSHILHSREKNLQLAEKLANQTILTMVGIFEADLVQLEKLKNASTFAKQSYALVHRDNHLGVATNTDVLNSLQIWQESKRNFERLRIATVFDYIKLLIESSSLSIEGKLKQNESQKETHE